MHGVVAAQRDEAEPVAAGCDTTNDTVAAVVVTWQPDPDALGLVLKRLRPQVDELILVDNSERAEDRAHARRLAVEFRCESIEVGFNSGIAQAQNLGIAQALSHGAQYLLLFDDDSDPADDLVARLRSGLLAEQAAGRRVAAVGPRVHDIRDDTAVLAFIDTVLGPRRASTQPGQEAMPAAFLVASGCLIDAHALRQIGPMREDLFIDHVDLEWALRARRAGWTLLVLHDVPLRHRLGERTLRPWPLRRRSVHVHAPVRNYYLVRNTLLLLRGRLMPIGWRAGYLIWLAKFALFNALCVAPRWPRALWIARGLRDGLFGRSGAARAGPSASAT